MLPSAVILAGVAVSAAQSKVHDARTFHEVMQKAGERQWPQRAAYDPRMVADPRASIEAALGELGYNVLSFCIHDSARRAHSIAAQGGRVRSHASSRATGGHRPIAAMARPM